MTVAWIALILLAALLISPFALGVPALKKSVRLAAEPKLRPVRIAEVDWADRGFFKRRARDFSAAGFESAGEYTFEPMVGNVLLIAPFLSAERRICGLSIQVASKRMRSLVLQFVSHIPSRITVTTSNNPSAEVFLYPPDRVLYRHPSIAVLSALLDQHLQNVALYGSMSSAASFLPEDIAPWIEWTARNEREVQAAHALEVRDGDFYRLTLKGAIRLTGRQWWHRVVGHWFD